MKQLFTIVALMVVMLLTSSGFNGNSPVLNEGDKVPEITVTNENGMFDLNECKGEYVLLTFWKSSDAQSRAKCNAYSAWFKNNTPNNLKHIAINFDTLNDVFEEIVRLDNFDSKAQFNVNGLEAAKIISSFGLEKGFGSILISPDGLVDTFNPTTSDLSSLI